MELNDGWISIYRKLLDSKIFDKPDKYLKIWMYILLSVNHTTIKNVKGYRKGEKFFKSEWIQEKCNATPDQVKKCLKWLRENSQIGTERSTRGLIIKVLKFEQYQDVKKNTAPTSALKKHQRSTTINNNVNNDNNINNNTSNILSKSKDLQETKTKICPTKNSEGTRNPTNEIINIFYQYSKNNRLFAMKCQRTAVEDLIKQFDIESVIKFAEFAISCNGKPYAPQITTPLQLQSKMGQLRAFHDQLKSKQTNTITKI